MASNAADARMRREDAANLLCEYGITPTVQRIDIAAVLLVRRQPVCAEEFQRLLARHGTAPWDWRKPTPAGLLAWLARILRRIIRGE